MESGRPVLKQVARNRFAAGLGNCCWQRYDMRLQKLALALLFQSSSRQPNRDRSLEWLRLKGSSDQVGFKAREAADSIKPGVKRSETPGMRRQKYPKLAERPTVESSPFNVLLSHRLSAASRAHLLFVALFPGVTLRFTPGFTPPAASRALKLT